MLRDSRRAFVLVWLVPLVIGWLAQTRLAWSRNLTLGTTLWLLAITVFVAGLVWARRQPGLVPDTAQEKLDTRRQVDPFVELGLFVAFVAIATWLRVWRIGTIPGGLNHDAAWNGLYATRIRQDGLLAPYVNEAWGRETLFHFVIAAWQMIVGPTKLAISLAAASVGIVTMGPLHLLARRLFGPLVALVASFLLAVNGWHLTFSKVGWRMILVPLLGALALYLTLRAVERMAVREFVWAGFATGCCLYTYDGGRGVPLAVGVFVLTEIWHRKTARITLFGRLAVLVGSAIVAALPLFIFALRDLHAFTGRSQFLWVGSQMSKAGSVQPLINNLKSLVGLYNWRGNGNDFFVKEPLLDLPVAVLFVFGLILALGRIRTYQYRLVLLTLAFGSLTGLTSMPNGNRNVFTIIAVLILAALAMVECVSWLARVIGDRPAMIAMQAVLALTLFAAYNSYLGPERRHQHGFYPEAAVVGEYMHDLSPSYTIHAAASNWPRDSMTYLSYRGDGDPHDRRYEYTTAPGELIRKANPLANPQAFIIEALPNNDQVVVNLTRRFPQAQVHDVTSSDYRVGPVAWAVLVPANPQTVELAELTAESAAADDRRRQDLAALAQVLAAWSKQHGSYPSTSWNVQTACVFADLDALCPLAQANPDLNLADELGEPNVNGYWYRSNGDRFVLFAALEGPAAETETCAPDQPPVSAVPNLLCVEGPSTG